MVGAVPSDLIPTKEAARILRRTVGTVCRWVADGKLEPAIKGTGPRGPMWFEREAIEAIRSAEDAKYVEPTEASA